MHAPLAPAFLRLPPELRNDIYHRVLAHQTSTIEPGHRLPGLLKTCRLVFAEAGPMYYSLTRFRSLAEEATVSWLSALEPATRALVSDVRYDVRWIVLHAWVMPSPETECYLFQRLVRRLKGKGVRLGDGVLKVNFYDWTGRLKREREERTTRESEATRTEAGTGFAVEEGEEGDWWTDRPGPMNVVP